MKLFMWVNIALLVLCIVGKLSALVTGRAIKSTPVMDAMDVVLYTALLVWAAVLLVNL